jgi:uncharacterized membrane protein YeaQ/YmgE (transglycosylase-associated protein family)
MGTVVLAIVLAIIGVLAGWLGPMAVNSRRPYGMAGDIIAAVLTMLVLGLVEWLWIIPLFGFPNWLNLAASIGDPLVLALIVLWLLRKVRPVTPAGNP